MTDYEKLKKIIDEADYLAKRGVFPTAPAFQSWYNLTERFLLKKYGKDSIELENFKNTRFSPKFYSENWQLIEKCREGLLACKLTFQGYLEDLEEENSIAIKSERVATYEKVFIVHGHDGELKEAVARIIEKQGLETIILLEKVNQGRTIIEKFEDYSDVDGAICLFTADDIGKAKKETTGKPRARQNVVLETGYFMGKLGRSHVVILADNEIEMPSDLSGVVYTNTSNWQVNLLRELEAMGYKIDFDKLS